MIVNCIFQQDSIIQLAKSQFQYKLLIAYCCGYRGNCTTSTQCTCNCGTTTPNCVCNCNCNCDSTDCGNNTECVCDCNPYDCNCDIVENCPDIPSRPMNENCVCDQGSNCPCACACACATVCSGGGGGNSGGACFTGGPRNTSYTTKTKTACNTNCACTAACVCVEYQPPERTCEQKVVEVPMGNCPPLTCRQIIQYSPYLPPKVTNCANSKCGTACNCNGDPTSNCACANGTCDGVIQDNRMGNCVIAKARPAPCCDCVCTENCTCNTQCSPSTCDPGGEPSSTCTCTPTEPTIRHETCQQCCPATLFGLSLKYSGNNGNKWLTDGNYTYGTGGTCYNGSYIHSLSISINNCPDGCWCHDGNKVAACPTCATASLRQYIDDEFKNFTISL